MLPSPPRSTAVALLVVLAAAAGGCRRATPTSREGRGGAPYVVKDVDVRTIPRSANGRDYLLYVAVPASYEREPQRRYPALYLCDGYWDFNLVKGFYGNLFYDRVIPEIIIVGFGYGGDTPDYDRLRRWDLTPVAGSHREMGAGGTGHASEFLQVIERDLIPFVEREYRVDPSYRALGGSSLGGLFALYTLFARPGLFQATIAPSPAVDWANDWLFRLEDDFAAKHGPGGTAPPARLFMTGAGDEDPRFLAAIKRFDARLSARAYPWLSYQFRLVDGERHAGTKAESYNRGTRFAFAPLAPRAEQP